MYIHRACKILFPQQRLIPLEVYTQICTHSPWWRDSHDFSGDIKDFKGWKQPWRSWKRHDKIFSYKSQWKNIPKKVMHNCNKLIISEKIAKIKLVI